MQSKVVGILGGLGPKATANLFRRIIKANPSRESWKSSTLSKGQDQTLRMNLLKKSL